MVEKVWSIAQPDLVCGENSSAFNSIYYCKEKINDGGHFEKKNSMRWARAGSLETVANRTADFP